MRAQSCTVTSRPGFGGKWSLVTEPAADGHEVPQQAESGDPVGLLGEEVGGSSLTQDLSKIHTTSPHRLLDPEGVCVSKCLSLPGPCL